MGIDFNWLCVFGLLKDFGFGTLTILTGKAIKEGIAVPASFYIALSFGHWLVPLPRQLSRKPEDFVVFMLSLSSILVLQFRSGFAIECWSAAGNFAACLLMFASRRQTGKKLVGQQHQCVGDYNIFFLHLIVSVLLSVALMNQVFKKKVWLVHLAMLGAYGLLTFMLLYSGSRRGIIFYTLPLLAIAILTLRRSKGLFIPLTAVIVLGILALSVLLPMLNENFKFTTIQRILVTIRQEGVLGMIGGRAERIAQAADYINGFTAFQLIFGAGTRAYTDMFGAGDHPHNFYFNAFIEGGLIKSTVAAILYLLFIGLGIVAARGRLFYQKVLICSVAVMYVLNICISGEDGLLLKLFWLLFVYFWCACNEDTEGQEATA